MEFLKINAPMANTPAEPTTWIDWFKNIQFFLLALIIPAWRMIDKYFEYQAKKDRDFIKSVVDESIRPGLERIDEKLDDMRRAQERDRDNFNTKITDIYKELRK